MFFHIFYMYILDLNVAKKSRYSDIPSLRYPVVLRHSCQFIIIYHLVFRYPIGPIYHYLPPGVSIPYWSEISSLSHLNMTVIPNNFSNMFDLFNHHIGIFWRRGQQVQCEVENHPVPRQWQTWKPITLKYKMLKIMYHHQICDAMHFNRELSHFANRG